MLGWIWRILVGRFNTCNHAWKIIQTIRIYSKDKQADTCGWIYIQECKKCGIVKRREMI